MKLKYAIGIVAIALAAFLLTGTSWADGKRDRSPHHGYGQSDGKRPGHQYDRRPDAGHHRRPQKPAWGNHRPNPGYHHGYGHNKPYRPNPGYHHYAPPHHGRPYHPAPRQPHYHHRPSSGYIFSAIISQPGFALGFATGGW